MGMQKIHINHILQNGLPTAHIAKNEHTADYQNKIILGEVFVMSYYENTVKE